MVPENKALCFLPICQSQMVPATEERPMVPATEMHGSCYQNPMIPTANPMVPATEPHWFLLKIPLVPGPLIPVAKLMVLSIEPVVPTSKALFSATKHHCPKVNAFLTQNPLVPGTEPYDSCNRVIWFLQQSHMVPATGLLDPCSKAHGSCIRPPLFFHWAAGFLMQKRGLTAIL